MFAAFMDENDEYGPVGEERGFFLNSTVTGTLFLGATVCSVAFAQPGPLRDRGYER